MDPERIIRDARRRAGLSQAELAGRAGTTQSAVARLESGRVDPRLSTLDALLHAAGERLELSSQPSRSGVDEAQVLRHLRMTPAQRLAAFEQSHAQVREIALAGRRARGELA
jgi:transcriptional regulator with XRE-family HTH domain